MNQRLDLRQHEFKDSEMIEVLSDSASVDALKVYLTSVIASSFPNLVEDAEDIAMSAIERMLTAQFDYFPTKFRSLAKKVAINIAIDIQRKASSQPLLPLQNDTGHTSMENEIVDSIVLHDAIRTLSPDEQDIILKYFYEGWTYHKIAEFTGLPTGTLFSRLQRIRLKLRKAMGQSDSMP